MAYIEIDINSGQKEKNISSEKINSDVIKCELCKTEEIFFNIFLECKLIRTIPVNSKSYIPYSVLEKPDGYQYTVAYYIPSRQQHIGFHKIIKEEESRIITSFDGPFLLDMREYEISDEITVKEINYYESNIPKFMVKVYAIIYNEKGEILLIEKAETETLKRKYCLPGGKVEKGESPLKALTRETKEETGLKFERKYFYLVHQMARKRETGETLIYIFFESHVKYSADVQLIKPEKTGDNVIWANYYKLPENSVSYLKYVLEYMKQGEFYSEYGY